MPTPATYGVAKYGDSKYSILAVLALIGNTTLSFNVAAVNKVKLLAMATVNFIFDINKSISNNLPYRRDKY